MQINGGKNGTIDVTIAAKLNTIDAKNDDNDIMSENQKQSAQNSSIYQISDEQKEVRRNEPLFKSSTPRKRCNILTKLESTLSPKYIGFLKPESDRYDERTRDLRRRTIKCVTNDQFKIESTSIEASFSQMETLKIESSKFTFDILNGNTKSKTKILSETDYISPPNELEQNTSQITLPLNNHKFYSSSLETSDDLINTVNLNSLDPELEIESFYIAINNNYETIQNSNIDNKQVFTNADNEKEVLSNIAVLEEEVLSNAVVLNKGNIDINENCGSIDPKFSDIERQKFLIKDNNCEKIIVNSAVMDQVKSPSSVSTVDSAKGSSINGNSATNFTTGDLFWGQIYSYCYWPCMVCPDPDGKTMSTGSVGRKSGAVQSLVHVRFFADNGRRNWVKKKNLIPYYGLRTYKDELLEIRKKYGKSSAKYKMFIPTQRKLNIWMDAIHEANIVYNTVYSERLEKFYEIFEGVKHSQRIERKRRKSMIKAAPNSDIDSLYDSSDNTYNNPITHILTTIKRERSTSPLSPAYSPIKNSSTKKIKLKGEEHNLETIYSKVSEQSDNPYAISDFVPVFRKHELFETVDFKKFYNAMKDFVMEGSTDNQVESSLVVAVKNIWALKQINQAQMHQRLIDSFNETDLGSSIIETGHSHNPVKRLSNRLKNIMIKRNLHIGSNLAIHEGNISIENKKSNEYNIIEKSSLKKSLNIPIEEVLDDIFNLDRRYLFKGLLRDPICKYCLRPGNNLLLCSKGCQSWLHSECIFSKNISNNIATNKNKMNNKRRTNKIDNEKIINNIQMKSTTMKSLESVICDECALKKSPKCYVCNNESSAIDGEMPIGCNMSNCIKYFHPSCCRYWPQAKITKSKSIIESFRCPSHVCQTCVSDDPKGKFQQLSNSKLVRCVKCPASYHMDSTCIPAGSEILTTTQLICPRHNTSKSDFSVNVNWCFICVGGGQVICCETCPTAVHASCLKIPIDANEGYICEECESGRLPLYGEMVWAKFNSFRWWPAIILPPNLIPQNIMKKSHNSYEFVVRFFGTHDHGWISRRRVYLYLEGDSSAPPRSKSGLDHSYNRGLQEAKKIYEVIKIKKLAMSLSNSSKEKLQPQPYVRIKANRAVPPLKLHIDLEKVNKCECNPLEEHPCGPESNCLNRVLYHECHPKICPAGERCENQMFESRISPRLEVVYLHERGFGLVSRETIEAGCFIIEYVGEVINDNEFRQRMSQKTNDRDENYYFLSVEKDYIIDAGPKGNMARFMNHSCDPNCETQKWSVNGLNRIGLFAIKDIPQNTELTFNYHWDDLLGTERKTCFCGTVKCSGQIGAKFREEKINKEFAKSKENKENPAIKTKKPLKRLLHKNRVTTTRNTTIAKTKKKLAKIKLNVFKSLMDTKTKKKL